MNTRILTAPLLFLLAVVGFLFWFVARGGGLVPQTDADEPLTMPENGAVDHRFHFLSAWDTARVPFSGRFDPAMGTEHGGLVYNAQKFWEMNEKRGGHHTGDDLNGIGGMNTDLGDPVFATADGLVIYAGEPSPGWGKLVVIAHRAPDGRPLHSMYAHLHLIDVTRGSLVPRGGRVGLVGTANGYYPAHLHFEMRVSDGVDIGAGYSMFPLNRLDPGATVSSLRNAGADELSPSPLGKAVCE
ncbi:MAG: M23 family metallopeptidase [Verrucomicrobiaceae bacterium]|nr:MAG: M23 family metallopeptidase [Verrucomicrobiaceae bacterium]